MADAVEDAVATAGGPRNSPELREMIAMFEESEDGTRQARLLAERDRDYYDHKQWTDEEKAALRKRKQPVVTYNRIQRKIDFLCGLERQTRKDPRAFPRNPGDEASAHAATDAIRFVCDQSMWDVQRSEAAKNLVIEGIGIVMVGVRQKGRHIDPDVVHVPWDRFFFDPHSSRPDFSDAMYMGLVIWKDVDEAVAEYPDREDAIRDTWNAGRDVDTYDDKPKDNLWVDYNRRRIRIVEIYYRKSGEWRYSVFTQHGFLVDPQASPYLDEDGIPECPLVAESLYVDRDNNRYGYVRGMISPQDEINKRHSKALHLINTRQARASRAALGDGSAEYFRRELARPDGVIVADPGDFEILSTNDMTVGNVNLLQMARAEIDLMGPNAALAGKNEVAMSGRAILAQQQGGMVEVATFLDRVRSLSLRVYAKVWSRIRQYWTSERWVRITDDQRNMRFVGINRPVTAFEALMKREGVTQETFNELPQDVQAQYLAFMQSPMGQQVVSIENNVGELLVDIVMDEGMDTPTIQAEQFDMLVKLATANPGAVPFDVLVEASALRNKDALLERLRQPNPMAEVQQRGAAASVALTEASAMLKQAQAAKAGVEAESALSGALAGAMSAA